MKLSKEYVLLIIVGLFILSYILDSVTNPLKLNLATPYSYLLAENMGRYPFSSISIVVKGVALYLSPVWLLSFINGHYLGKASFLLVFGSMLQLYALQDVMTKSLLLPLEWSLGLSLAGLVLLIQAAFFFIQGFFLYLKTNLSNARMEAVIEELQEAEKVDK